jgi:hypothetical protein
MVGLEDLVLEFSELVTRLIWGSAAPPVRKSTNQQIPKSVSEILKSRNHQSARSATWRPPIPQSELVKASGVEAPLAAVPVAGEHHGSR